MKIDEEDNMLYFIIMLMTVFSFCEIKAIIKTRKALRHSSDIIEAYPHRKIITQVLGAILIFSPVIVFLIIDYLESLDLIYLTELWFFAWLSWYTNTSDIEIYNEGVVINYRYIKWCEVKTFTKLSSHAVLIKYKSIYLGDIRSRNIVNVDALIHTISKNVQNLNNFSD